MSRPAPDPDCPTCHGDGTVLERVWFSCATPEDPDDGEVEWDVVDCWRCGYADVR